MKQKNMTEIVEINGEYAFPMSKELLKEMGWQEGDCLTISKTGHTLHITKVVLE